MKRQTGQSQKIPSFPTDKAAETFIENSDLTEYDLSQFKPVRYEFRPKEARINMRLPEQLLTAVKDAARCQGAPYQRYIRQVLEQALSARE